FARYSTDTEWLAPHFEKMLYDNALLLSVLSEAYQSTKKLRYREVIEETMVFVQRELLHPDGAFYSALDADTEGEEGKFYVWDNDEVLKILGGDAALFCEYYDITPSGNWEGKNILRVKESIEQLAGKKNISVDELKKVLIISKEKMLFQRSKRKRPLLDDKIILGWNALMNIACSKTYAATGNSIYKELAIKNIKFLLAKFKGEGKAFYHTWKNDEGKYPAFLDDCAFLIEALIYLNEITSETEWLLKAEELTTFVLENFNEEETSFFFFTHRDQKDVIIRKKEVYDGAIPSGNSVMGYNLLHLSILLDNPIWRKRSYNMISALSKAISKYPTSFGIWISLFQELIYGTDEIAIVGENFNGLLEEVISAYIPHKVLMASPNPNTDQKFPLLAGKPVNDLTFIYLCKKFSCLKPVISVQELLYLKSLENV
ncbi:MAG: AGE family epimerase/isomerase, partial [Bacteroidota bacterium]|nr:AGE family epimerase/isomerase [Bacteroidota bacterium]